MLDKKKLYLIDDQVLFVDMLTGIIEHRTDDITVVGSASNGNDAFLEIPTVNPDVLLLDVRMPDMDGIEILTRIRQSFPDLKVVMLTTFQDIEKAKLALEYGACGFLLKNMSVNDLIDKIRTILKGDMVISSQIAQRMFQRHSASAQEQSRSSPQPENTSGNKMLEKLSKREKEVYKLLVLGYSNSEIAERLFIARQTVKNHIYSIYTKIGYHDRFKIISDNR